MIKHERKLSWARLQEARGKRAYGQRPKRTGDRSVVFVPWNMILKERRRRARRMK